VQVSVAVIKSEDTAPICSQIRFKCSFATIILALLVAVLLSSSLLTRTCEVKWHMQQ